MIIDYTTYLAHAKNFRERFLILHYTAGNFQSAIEELTGNQVSVHYVIPTLKTLDPSYPYNQLRIFCLVGENERAWHAGTSAWGGRTNLNDSSIGIELVNESNKEQFKPYPKEQIDLLISLCHNIQTRYPDISPTQVLGHSDIAIGRKIDPGPKFPWKRLHDNGIGAWYDNGTVNQYKKQFQKKPPTRAQFIAKLEQYGYRNTATPYALIKAFQMHFRPEDDSGTLDLETAAIAYALADKYILSSREIS